MGATVPYQMGGACQICESIMTQGHAFGMFRCKQRCINAIGKIAAKHAEGMSLRYGVVVLGDF